MQAVAIKVGSDTTNTRSAELRTAARKSSVDRCMVNTLRARRRNVKPRVGGCELSSLRVTVSKSTRGRFVTSLAAARLAFVSVVTSGVIACAPGDDLPIVARGRYVEIATERDEPICGGTVDYLDRVVEAGFAVLGETPPDRVFIRYEWLALEAEPVIGGGRAVIVDDGILIRSDVYLVEEHELVHAIHLQAWPTSNEFLQEGLAVLMDAKRNYGEKFPWPQTVDLDAVIGATELPYDQYHLAWFIVSQVVLDHGFDGLRSFWHAVPSGASAAEVREAYSSLFGRPIDRLLEPYFVDYGPAGLVETDRSPCNFALCPAAETPWADGRWSAAGPADCAEDSRAIGPDMRSHLYEHGEVWRDYTIRVEPGDFDTVISASAGIVRISCSLDCTHVGLDVSVVGGTFTNDRWTPGGPWRVEVRDELADLPTTPGSYTVEESAPR